MSTRVLLISTLALSFLALPAAADVFEASPSTISLPDGPGSIMGMGEEFDVAPGTGVATYAIAIPTLPAPGGFSPTMRIRHQSGAGNGPLGVGWGLESPRLCRKTDAGAPVYGGPDDGDSFFIDAFDGGGDIMPLAGQDGVWGPRVEGSWIRLQPMASSVGDGEGWEVRFRDGTRAHYGTRPGHREGPRPEHFGGTFCWTLSERIDVFGRRISYEYIREGGRLQLSEVRYAEETPHPRAVRIHYGQRGDVFSDWTAGYERVQALRVERIESLVVSSHRDGGERIVRTMVLEYEESWNASRLVRVSMQGEDGLELPAQTFRYHVFDPRGGEAVEEFDAPRVAPNDGRHRLVDLNGNGRPDVLRIGEAGRWEWYPNEGGRGFAREAIVIPEAPTLAADADWQFVDVNGNGRRDILSRTTDGRVLIRWNESRGGPHVAFSSPEELDVALPVPLNSPALHVGDLNGNRRPDFLWSAGGQLWLAESILIRDEDGRVTPQSQVLWDEPVATGDKDGGGSGVRGLDRVELDAAGLHLVDMNGDGLPDIVRVLGGAGRTASLVIHDGLGDGRFAEGRELTNLPAGVQGRAPADLQLIDLDGSGLADLVAIGSSSVTYWLNEAGRQFGESRELPLPERSNEGRVAVADLNGNGSTDFIVVDPRQERGWTLVDPIGSQPNGLLIEARNGLGGVYTIEYGTLDDAEQASLAEGVAWRSWSPQPMTMVTARILADGRGHVHRTEHRYRDPVFNDRTGSFVTFESATVRQVGDEQSPDRVTDHVFFRGTTGDLDGFGGALEGEVVSTLPPYIEGLGGQTRAVITRDADGALYSRQLSRVDVTALDDGRPLVLVTGQLSDAAERLARAPNPGDWFGEGDWPDAALREPAEGEMERRLTLVEIEFDGWGNALRQTAWGHVDAAGRNLPGDEVVTETTWINDTERWMIGFPAEERILDRRGEVLSRTRTYYDGTAFEGLAFGSIDRGLVTRVESWLEEEQRWVQTQRTSYDAHGNPVASMDAMGHVVELEWDSALHMVPVRERIRLDRGEGSRHRSPGSPDVLEVRAEHDLDLGLMVSMTDFNGQVTRLTYDGLGRVVARQLPGDTEDRPSTLYTYTFGDPVSWVETAQLEAFDREDRIVTRTYTDGFGREITSVREHGERGSGQWIASGWTTYTATGDVGSVFLAFLSPSVDLPGGPDKDTAFTTLFHDAAGRTVRTVFEDGSEEAVLFGAGLVRTFDANRLDSSSPFHGLAEETITDGQGRVTLQRLFADVSDDGVREYAFRWDPRGLPLARVLPDGTETRWAHDSLGRTVRAEDPNAGVHVRHFDDLGRVMALEDASGGLVLSAHDAAGRLVEVAMQMPGGEPVVDARYVYDAGVDGFPSNQALGRLTARLESGFDTFLDYDVRGQVSRLFRRFDGRVYVSGADWDAAGRVAAHHYMDGTALRLRYDAQGNLRQYGDVVRDVDYTVEGQLERMALGNGLEQVMAYDLRLRPMQYTLGRPGADPLLDLEQRYDSAGIPTALVDNVTPTGRFSQSAIFSVDGLYRPVAMESPALGGTVLYEYNRGNSLVSRVLDGEPLEGTDVTDLSNGVFEMGGVGANDREVGPHQVSRVGDRHLGYDRSGRLVTDARADGVRELSWDPAGRLRVVTLPDGGRVVNRYNGAYERQLRQVYDADGNLVEQAVYFDERHELRTTPGRGTELLKIVNVGGERVAEIRVGDDPGVAEESFSAPRVAPWAGALGAEAVVALPPGSGRGHPGGTYGGPAALVVERTRRALRRARSDLRTLEGWWPLLPLGGGAFLVLVALGGTGPRRRRLVLARLSLATGTVVLLGTSATLVMSCADDGGSSDTDTDRDDVSANGEIHYLHAPRLGTVTLRTDANGRVVMRAHRTPFGVETAVERLDNAPAESWFTGKEVDASTGYIYFGARWYDPSLGTFLSPDPLPLWEAGVSWGDANPMAYVGNRPTFVVDPTGLSGEGFVSRSMRPPTPEQVLTHGIDAGVHLVGSEFIQQSTTVGSIVIGQVKFGAAMASANSPQDRADAHRALAPPIPLLGEAAAQGVLAANEMALISEVSDFRNVATAAQGQYDRDLGQLRRQFEYMSSTVRSSEDLAAFQQEFLAQEEQLFRAMQGTIDAHYAGMSLESKDWTPTQRVPGSNDNAHDVWIDVRTHRGRDQAWNRIEQTFTE